MYKSDSLAWRIVNTIKKYSEEHGNLTDVEIVGALVVIAVELLEQQKPEMQAAMRGAIRLHIDGKAESTARPRTLQ